MDEFDPVKYKAMVKFYQEKDDPMGWFNSIYTDANGDHNNVFWADLEASPYLLEWMNTCSQDAKTKKAIVIGCGVGDDAEALSKRGYKVTAFDIAPEAIALCKKRYPDTKVNYLVADLFDYPAEWRENFDLIYECNTIQVLPGKYRTKARDAMISLMASDAYILVSCRSRNKGEQEDDIPLPLDRDEIDGFVRCRLSEESFLAYDDNQEPPVPHFFGCYRKIYRLDKILNIKDINMTHNNNLTHFEEAKAGVENAVRTFLQIIPAIGSPLNQAIFGTHDIIQMQRILKFILSIQELINNDSIQKSTLNMIDDYLSKDDGQEYIYLIIEKSKKIRNKEKIEYLRNIFLNHSSATKTMDLDNAESYLNLIENLTIESILILKFMSSFVDLTVPKRGADKAVDANAESYSSAVLKKFDFDSEDINYYHQQLITYGLAIDDGAGRFDATPFNIMIITKRGRQLLKFIDNPI